MFYPHVKSEAEASPDLSPVHHNFHFKFPPSHDHQSRTPSDPPTPLYRFGQYPTNPANPSPPSSHTISYMSYSDDYDDLPIHNYPQSASDRTIRRRSSKACDQCRKSKCKCERSSPNEPCKSCIMLGTPCTFLGPSRKRGPPKGYIDAIEARLHQTEALVGIMLATKDPRAQSLLRDIARDPLAKEIIIRVDASPYGVKGRKRNTTTPTVEHHASSPTTNKKTSTTEPDTPKDEGKIDLTSTHPSNEWQDKVVDMLGAGRTTEPTYIRPTPSTSTTSNGGIGSGKPTLRVATYTSDDHSPSDDGGRERRRRRLGDEDYDYEGITAAAAAAGLPSPTSTSASLPSSKEEEKDDGLEEENQLAQAVGELSLNEDEEVRYHGQASGLYLLGETERIDKRNEGGIWRFPGARVWPPLPPPTTTTTTTESRENDGSESEAGHVTSWPQQQQQQQQSTSDTAHRAATSSPALHKFSNGLNGEELLPPRHEQERLLELYFIYVHPSFPVVHKKAFWEVWRHGEDVDPYTKRTYRITPLLLLTMFALAARYDIPPPTSTTTTADSPSSSPPSPSSSSPTTTTTAAQPTAEASSPTTPLPTDGISMWTAGEQYFNSAKNILDTSYASSRPSTCQALLLMGYREVGIGAMALAWTYVGMAIRMAQDLGMHRKAEGWRRPGLLGGSNGSSSGTAGAAAGAVVTNEDSEMEGTAAPATTTSEEAGRIFGDWELGERRRIWFGCVVMDKYVSAYIGRPLMISERDFDTQVPELSESEEMEEWKALGVDGQWTTPVPGRVVSCFNKCAELSGVLSAIIQAIYAVRPFPTGPNPSPTFRPGGGGGSGVGSVGSRQVETAKQVTALEGTLDRWYLDLPHHLRYDTAAVTIIDRGVDATNNTTTSSSLPPAHVLTLHMQYWCAVLLLHRPFIRKALNSNKTKTGAFSSGMISEEQHQTLPDLDDLEVIKSRRSYELCVSAANYITSIVTAYRERYPLNRCSVFLCYYVFTASIMHVITLKAYPDDPQAPINLRRCLDALSAMRYVWPSAGRALELLTGAKMNLMMTTGGGGPPPPSARAYAVNGNHKASSSAVSSNKRKSSTIALDEEKVHPSASSASSSMVNGVSMEGGGRGGGGGGGAEFVTPIRSVAGLSAHMDQQQQQHHQHHQQHSVQLQHRLRESASQQQLGQYRPIRQQHQHQQHHTYHTATPTDNYSIQPPTLLVPTDYGWPVSGSSGVRNVTAGGENSGARGAAAHLPEEDQEFVPLSTSVLPQLYSTGLVDEHPHTVHHRHHPSQPPPHLLAATAAAAAPTTSPSSSSSHHGGQTHPQHIQQGYTRSGEIIPHPYGHTTQPQYWSDYSTFSQLESTEAGGGYGSLDVGVGGVGAMEMVLPGSQHPQQQQQQQQQQQPHLLSHSQHPNVSSVSGMYLPDSYDLYGDGYR